MIMKQSDNFSLNIPAGSPAECFRQSLRISAKDFEHKEPETPAQKQFRSDFFDCPFFGDTPWSDHLSQPEEEKHGEALHLVPQHVDAKDVALAFLESKMKVWCNNKKEWETDNLSLLPSGDFIDEKGRINRRKSHTAYVTLEDALEAIEVYLMNMDEVY